MKDIKVNKKILDDLNSRIDGNRYVKTVRLGRNNYVVEIDNNFIWIEGECYWREGDNIIEQVSNAVLQHENWLINSNELKSLNEWDGIIG